MKIGELSKETGISVETIRYYESIKLIPKPKTAESGYRYYTKEYKGILGFVKAAKGSGFSLREIKVLLRLRKCSEVNKVVTMKLREIEGKIKTFNGIKVKLSKLLKKCPNNNKLTDCTILKSFYKPF